MFPIKVFIVSCNMKAKNKETLKPKIIYTDYIVGNL